MKSSPTLTIRPYWHEDAEDLFAAVIESREDLAPWMPWCHPEYSIAESKEWLRLQVENFRQGEEYDFAIVSSEDCFLGGCGLNFIDVPNRRANLGYWVRTSEKGRGVATSAVRQLVEWAFERTELCRLEVVVAAGNLASLRVAERAGATREGLLRARIVLHGEAHDAVMYSFVRTGTGANRIPS